jgi:hypothetical protein
VLFPPAIGGGNPKRLSAGAMNLNGWEVVCLTIFDENDFLFLGR